jgi:hypothetical protein
LTKENRPKGFPKWSKNGRDRPAGRKVPDTAKLDDMRATWWKWWDSANPTARSRDEGRILPDDCDCWEELHLPGKEGFRLFLIALRWWYDLAEGVDKEWYWEQALKSVYITMCKLLDDLRCVVTYFRYFGILILARNSPPRQRDSQTPGPRHISLTQPAPPNSRSTQIASIPGSHSQPPVSKNSRRHAAFGPASKVAGSHTHGAAASAAASSSSSQCQKRAGAPLDPSDEPPTSRRRSS